MGFGNSAFLAARVQIDDVTIKLNTDGKIFVASVPPIANETAVTTTYSVGTSDEIILANATSAAFTVTLPAANAQAGRKVLIIKTDSSANAVTVSRAGSDTIEGSTTKSLASQYNKIGLISDGTSTWYDLGTGGGI